MVQGMFSNTYLPGFRAIVGTELESSEVYYSRYVNIKTSDRKKEDAFAAAGLPIAQLKPERETFPLASPLEGGTKTVTFDETWGIGVEYSLEEWEDDLYAGGKRASAGVGNSPGNLKSPIRKGAEDTAWALRERVEIEAHRPFTAEGFDGSTFTVLPDSSGLFATSHSPVTGGLGPAQSNRPSSAVALSVSALRTALQLFPTYKDDQGKRIPGYVNPKTLVHGPNLMHIAPEVLNNPTRADMPESNIKNVTAGVVSASMTPFISTNFWFILGQRHGIDFWWRWRPRSMGYDDVGRGVMVLVAFQRFKIFPISWLGTYGSNPS